MSKLAKTAVTASVLAATALVSLPAAAEVSGNVALTTDYMWRGVSQSDSDPAIQGGFDYAHPSGFSAGVWGSNVDFDETVADSADMELDLYASYGNAFANGLGWSVGAIHYDYPGTDADLNWDEVNVGASYKWFSASVNYSDNVFNSDHAGTYYNLGFNYDLPQDFTVSAAYGMYRFDKEVNGAGNPDSYNHYSIGISKALGGFGFDLTYYDSNDDAETLYGDDWTKGRAVFTVSKSL